MERDKTDRSTPACCCSPAPSPAAGQPTQDAGCDCAALLAGGSRLKTLVVTLVIAAAIVVGIAAMRSDRAAPASGPASSPTGAASAAGPKEWPRAGSGSR
ncbi:MAG: hypothetical protein HY815_23880 [Candidatus Riflebacteria bacterium]|nr:hypothetical protein [Candidatus Riflebacteria bacterium]